MSRSGVFHAVDLEAMARHDVLSSFEFIHALGRIIQHGMPPAMQSGYDSLLSARKLLLCTLLEFERAAISSATSSAASDWSKAYASGSCCL